MSIDTFGVTALVDELTARLTGGRVQDTVDVDGASLLVEFIFHRVAAQGHLNDDIDVPWWFRTDGNFFDVHEWLLAVACWLAVA